MTNTGWPLTLPTWKTLYDRLETALTPPLQVLLGTESVNRIFAVWREQMVVQQRMMRTHLERSWDLLRLPSKSDLARVAGQVIQLETNLETIDSQLIALEARMARMAPADAPDVQASLEAMRQQLDTLCDAVTAMAEPAKGTI